MHLHMRYSASLPLAVLGAPRGSEIVAVSDGPSKLNTP